MYVSERWCYSVDDTGIVAEKEHWVLPIGVELTTFRLVPRMLHHWALRDLWLGRSCKKEINKQTNKQKNNKGWNRQVVCILAFKLFTVANLRYQLSWQYQITLLYSPTDVAFQFLKKLSPFRQYIRCSTRCFNCFGAQKFQCFML